jgi:hypothetical protein
MLMVKGIIKNEKRNHLCSGNPYTIHIRNKIYWDFYFKWVKFVQSLIDDDIQYNVIDLTEIRTNCEVQNLSKLKRFKEFQ